MGADLKPGFMGSNLLLVPPLNSVSAGVGWIKGSMEHLPALVLFGSTC